MSAVDQELEKLLEELTAARARLETRVPLIKEALEELPHCESVRLENYIGFGRSLPVNDAVREAFHGAAEEEVARLTAAVEDLRTRVVARQMALENIGSPTPTTLRA
jgi:hypothetical protein